MFLNKEENVINIYDTNLEFVEKINGGINEALDKIQSEESRGKIILKAK